MKNYKIVFTEADSQLAAGPELKDGKELKNEATLNKEPSELNADIENKDVYDNDSHKEAEEVGEEIFENYNFDDFKSLREEFEYLNKPNHRIVIVNSKTYNNLSKEMISKYHMKNTKIIIIENDSLLHYLKIDNQSNNKVYVYYPPKLPFILSSPELCDQNINQY